MCMCMHVCMCMYERLQPQPCASEAAAACLGRLQPHASIRAKARESRRCEAGVGSHLAPRRARRRAAHRSTAWRASRAAGPQAASAARARRRASPPPPLTWEPPAARAYAWCTRTQHGIRESAPTQVRASKRLIAEAAQHAHVACCMCCCMCCCVACACCMCMCMCEARVRSAISSTRRACQGPRSRPSR